MGILVVFGAIALMAVILSGWAHQAQRSRALAVGLYLIFGLLSTGLVLLGIFLVLVPGQILGPQPAFAGADNAGVVMLATGIAGGLSLVPPVRRLLAQLIPIDPKSLPDMVGLVLLLGAIGFFGGMTILLDVNPQQGQATVPMLVGQSVALVAVAFLGVGALFTRDLRSAASRLGLEVPTARQVAWSLVLVVVAFMITAASGLLTNLLQPELSRAIEDRMAELIEGVSSLRGAIILGVTAGIGEEILFRGAIQPRYGIVLTSIAFALVHVQYGLSLVTLGVFLVSVLFGIERARMNTTAAIITHVVYDIVAVLIAQSAPAPSVIGMAPVTVLNWG